MDSKDLVQYHLRSVFIQHIFNLLERALLQIREADSNLSVFRTRDKTCNADADSYLCKNSMEKVLNQYIKDSKESSQTTHNDMIVSLYGSYSATQLIDCLRSLFGEQCDRLGQKLTNKTETMLPATSEQQLTKLHYIHVSDAMRQVQMKKRLKILSGKVNSLQAQLEFRSNLSEKFPANIFKQNLRKHSLKVAIETMEGLVTAAQQQLTVRKLNFSEHQQLERGRQSFLSELRRCEQMIESLRVENRTLALSLSVKQQQALDSKTEMLQHLKSTHRSLQELVTTNPLQRLLPLLKRSDSFTNWRLPSREYSVSSLTQNVLCQNSFYNKCCALLKFQLPCQHPDSVLRNIASLALNAWVTAEEVERLRDSVLILEEESRTISMIHKRDLHMQNKARQRVKSYMDRINTAIEKIRCLLSSTQLFTEDWKQLALSISRKTIPLSD